MELMQAVRTCRAVRECADRLVDRETVSALLEAASQTPSAVNQ